MESRATNQWRRYVFGLGGAPAENAPESRIFFRIFYVFEWFLGSEIQLRGATSKITILFIWLGGGAPALEFPPTYATATNLWNRGPRTYGDEGHEPIVDNGNLDTIENIQKNFGVFLFEFRSYFIFNGNTISQK